MSDFNLSFTKAVLTTRTFRRCLRCLWLVSHYARHLFHSIPSFDFSQRGPYGNSFLPSSIYTL